MHNTEYNTDNTELYDDLLQSHGQYRYSLKQKTKTLLVCSALLFTTSGAPSIPALKPVDLSANEDGSNAYLVSNLYLSDSYTWSDIKIASSPTEEVYNEILDTFSVLKKLTFLEVDEIAEKEADQFFNKITMKTKKIMVNKKA